MRRAAQLSFDDARRKAPAGPALTVLPDAARVEEHLVRRAVPFVAGRVACTLAQLERELIREARAAGACPEVASPEALALLFRDVCREETPREGPFWGIRDQPGFARAAQDLLAALGQGLLEPSELERLSLPEAARERIAPLATLLVRARHALDRRGLADPNRALRLAIEALAAGGELPASLRSAPEVTFDAIFDWTPLRVRTAAVLAGRLRVRVRLPWSAQPDLRSNWRCASWICPSATFPARTWSRCSPRDCCGWPTTGAPCRPRPRCGACAKPTCGTTPWTAATPSGCTRWPPGSRHGRGRAPGKTRRRPKLRWPKPLAQWTTWTRS